MSTIKALAPWFGAKRSQATAILDALGPHTAYYEPMAGSLAILMAKEPCRQEVANDLHGRLVNLARVVQDDDLSVKLFDRCRRTAFCEALHQESAARLKAAPDGTGLEAAYDYLTVSWMGRNGLAGTDKELATGFCKRFTSGGGDPAVRWKSVVESVPWWWERLRGVTILSEDGVKLLGRVEDKVGTAVYLDPPYVKKSASYAVDFAGGDHGRLALAANRFEKTRVVVSYYADASLDRLYPAPKWRRIDATTTKSMTNGKAEAPEILFVGN
jgi:DNA adenine methylase